MRLQFAKYLLHLFDYGICIPESRNTPLMFVISSELFTLKNLEVIRLNGGFKLPTFQYAIFSCKYIVLRSMCLHIVIGFFRDSLSRCSCSCNL